MECFVTPVSLEHSTCRRTTNTAAWNAFAWELRTSVTVHS